MIGIVVDESASFTIGLLTWITRVDYPRPAALKAYKKVLCHFIVSRKLRRLEKHQPK